MALPGGRRTARSSLVPSGSWSTNPLNEWNPNSRSSVTAAKGRTAARLTL